MSCSACPPKTEAAAVQEIDRLSDFESWCLTSSEGAPAIAVEALDLRAHSALLLARRWLDCLFLGCDIEAAAAGHIVSSGGVVLPNLQAFLFPVHRSKLYDAEELFAGFDPTARDGYGKTWDDRVYRQYLAQGKDQPASIQVTLARRLHDHSITDGINELVAGRKVVAVMGGHAMERRDPFYASVARIARRLTREGYLTLSGGGPGAMEATHLGAWFAPRPDVELDEALAMLAPRPTGAAAGMEYADWDWLHRAWRVLQRFPLDAEERVAATSLGIPTWLYGHEPPAPFATHIGKYFANSVREDGLLALAVDGVIFAPGSAGTTQEIFQDATQNHYGTAGFYSPMILFGRQHWTERRPVWPLLEHVAAGKAYGELLVLTDDEDEVVRHLLAYRRDQHVAR